MSARLVLQFLGLPQVYLDNTPVVTDRRKAIALLAYLAVNDIGHPTEKYSRESLSALFWPDYDQVRAFSNLRRTVWEVHQAIGEGWLIASRESLRLNPDREIELDVARFRDLISQGYQQTEAALRIPLLLEAAKIYRNHFLTGFSLKDALNFNEWAFAESEELRRQLAEALAWLAEDYCTLGQADQAIPYARRLVSLDPLNESAHRQLMQVYLQASRHSAALKQYQACEQILRKELGVDPQPETYALYKQIRRGDLKPVQVVKPSEPVSPRHNLPLQLSSFIGREEEQDEIIQLIAKNRLVTLAGVGGIGKTRLSMQVGQELLNNYPEGIWLTSLESLSDPALVPQTIASVFGIREESARPVSERLIESLRERALLLILDNCEHLLGACAQIAATLLQNCPNLKIIATSRETLNLPGEAIYSIPSLSLPERDVVIEKLAVYESTRLFIERAALALPSFTLTKQDAQTVVEICRKVDGIPLAIELAAARVNLLQVEEILKQLQESFALLSSDARTISPRHQTLRASLDWSWGLLAEPEQILMRQLSVFAGGWTLESAQAVCDGDVLVLLGALVKKSLIVVNQEPGRETRYRFHAMVQEYAHEKLIDSGEEENFRTRHLTYSLDLAEQAEFELTGPARVDWMERLNDEHNNVRAALHWAAKTDIEAGLYLSGRLRRYWESSDLREGTQWLENFLHRSESRDFPLARAHALHAYGWLLTWLQQFNQAHSVTEESLQLFRAAGDRQGEADALLSLGNIEQFLERWDLAVDLIHRSLVLAQSLDDPWREANAYYYLGWDRRNFERGMSYWEKALRLYRKVGDQIALANLLGVLGQFRVLNGEIESGEKYLDEAMLLWQSNRRANIWENPKIAKSLILLTRGEHEQAYALLEEALRTVKETGNRMSQLWVRVRLGYVALRAGRLDEARDILIEAAQDFHKDGYTMGAVFALEGMAGLYAQVGKPEHSARLIGLADATREKVGDTRLPLEQADVDKIIAACLAKMGEVAFSDAYDEGTAMQLDEAIAYALRED